MYVASPQETYSEALQSKNSEKISFKQLVEQGQCMLLLVTICMGKYCPPCTGVVVGHIHCSLQTIDIYSVLDHW